MDLFYLVSIWLLPVLIAITFHEAAHGYVARLLGDDTAFRLGRVSLNPLRHIDPFGTVLLPGLLLLARSPFLFGYAKPVPVKFSRSSSPPLWHGACGGGRACNEYLLGNCCRIEFSSSGLLARNDRTVGCAELKKCARYQCRPGGLQSVPQLPWACFPMRWPNILLVSSLTG